MFDEMRTAINAGEIIMDKLEYWHDNTCARVSDYKSKDGLDEWESREFAELTAMLDLYDEVKKTVVKWVKSQC